MDNQHRQIKGYQEMDQSKIDLFNKITATGTLLEELCNEVRDFNSKEESGQMRAALNSDRWVAMAATDFQVALMKLKRGLAKPTTF